VTSPLVITTNSLSAVAPAPASDQSPTTLPATSTTSTSAPASLPGGTPSAIKVPTVTRPFGVVVLSGAARANAKKIKVSTPLSNSASRAPEISVLIGEAVAPVVNGLPARLSLQASMSVPAPTRAKPAFVSIGKTRSSASGQATVPAFKANRAGVYTIRLVTPASKAFYLKVKVSAKKPSLVVGKQLS